LGRVVALAHVRVYLAGDIVDEGTRMKRGEWVRETLWKSGEARVPGRRCVK